MDPFHDRFRFHDRITTGTAHRFELEIDYIEGSHTEASMVELAVVKASSHSQVM
jgi:hypothetical protein